jgi:hypothetical protein
MSDHLAANHRVLFGHNLIKSVSVDKKDRRNLFFIHGMPPQKVSRAGSTIDIYPTVLEALGYEIRERKANLVVSLLSDKNTLVESYGTAGVQANCFCTTAGWLYFCGLSNVGYSSISAWLSGGSPVRQSSMRIFIAQTL